MSVELYDDFVLKRFKPVYGFKKRYYTEKQALGLLKEINGVPKILSYSDQEYFLKISRLKGEPCMQYSKNALQKLRSIMNETINNGVARHSLPLRDIILDEEDNVGVVDFERATLKKNCFFVFWYIATLVTKFHVIRFIYNQNANLLSLTESILVKTGLFFRKIFNVYQLIRDAIRNSYRKFFLEHNN
jgi:hypothetical protein